MRKTSNLAAKIAGAGALALLLATSAFADDGPRDRTWRGDQRDGNYRQSDRRDNNYQGDRRDNNYQGDRRDNNYQGDRRDNNYRNNDQRYQADRDRGGSRHEYRNNERVRESGRIRTFSHERGGYRVWLENRPYAFWVPEARWHSGWRVGINVNFGGVYRDGVIYNDVYDDPYYDGGAYRDGYAAGYVSGWVNRVDYRSGTVWLREDRSDRIIAIDLRSVGRYSRVDARDLRRGDRISVTGQWVRGGLFVADRIDSIDSGRY
jgi:hypothetical protein